MAASSKTAASGRLTPEPAPSGRQGKTAPSGRLHPTTPPPDPQDRTTSPADALNRVDPLQFRHVMGHFPTGVTVITTVHDGQRHGMTANSVTSVSLDPVLILVCLIREARTALAIQKAGRFAVNMLREDQEHMSRRFAKAGQDHFEGLDIEEGPAGLPLLPNCLAYLTCRTTEVVAAGDHDIVLAEVEHAQANSGNPLVFFLGGYRRLPGMGRLG